MARASHEVIALCLIKHKAGMSKTADVIMKIPNTDRTENAQDVCVGFIEGRRFAGPVAVCHRHSV